MGYKPRRVDLMRGYKGTHIVVDGSSVIRAIEANSGSNWSHNGDYQLIQQEANRLASAFDSAGIKLVVVFDGGLSE